MSKPHVLGFTAVALVVGMTQAGASTTINFNTFPGSTPVSSVDGVTFALDGGPDSSGVPSTIYAGYGDPITLDNTNSGVYPTANSLDVTFPTTVTGLSFTFWNYGTSAPTTYTAYNSASGVVDTGSLQFVSNSGLVSVSGSGIKSLVFNNNFASSANWQYGVAQITFTSAVPEPASLALVGAGLAGLGLVRRRRRTA